MLKGEWAPWWTKQLSRAAESTWTCVLWLPLGSSLLLLFFSSQTQLQASQRSLLSYVLWWFFLPWLGCMGKPLPFVSGCDVYPLQLGCVSCLVAKQWFWECHYITLQVPRRVSSNFSLLPLPSPYDDILPCLCLHGAFPLCSVSSILPLPSWLHSKLLGRGCSKGFVRWAVEHVS